MAESFLSQIGDFTLIDCSHSPLNGVIFHNVQTVYSADEAIKCIYSITESIEPEDGDIIGLFKVGWVSPSEAYSSVAAKLPVNKERTFLHTVFEDHQLPSDSADLYQFCYVTKRGVVGASTPFAFESNDIIAVEDPADPGLLVFKSRVSQLKDELLKLSDEKSYYASKYEVLNDNFLKLKNEFDKLELELNSEREVAKQMEDANMILTRKLMEQLKIDNNGSERKEVLRNVEDDIISADTEVVSKLINSGVWKSLYEIYEVVEEVNRSLKSNIDDIKLSYQDLTDYILGVFTETRKKFQIKDREKVDKPEYCSCYFQQKAFCCPKLCNEAQFEYMMTQPLYTCFSNFNHYTDDGNDKCDGTFDPNVLKDYMQTVSQPPVYTINNSELIKNVNSVNVSSVNINEPLLNGSDKIIEERDKAVMELKVAREKIAALVSRVDVLELELVAQKSNQLSKIDSFTENKSKCSVSSSTLKSSDIENILESVNSEYISLKDKYNELSKKVAKSDSIETRCALLEVENKKLISYFTQERAGNKHHVLPKGQICGDLGNLIVEKEKAESKLINLQKESVGKISVNLIRQENQDSR